MNELLADTGKRDAQYSVDELMHRGWLWTIDWNNPTRRWPCIGPQPAACTADLLGWVIVNPSRYIS